MGIGWGLLVGDNREFCEMPRPEMVARIETEALELRRTGGLSRGGLTATSGCRAEAGGREGFVGLRMSRWQS